MSPDASATTVRHRPHEGATVTETGTIRVVLVDDHGVVRRGLRGYLELLDDIEVIGEAENGLEAVDTVDQLIPDVVLMDIVMPQLDGIGAITRIKAAHPEVQLVALTSFIEEEKVTAALEAGASGFILKDAEADDVAAAIRAAHNDEVHLDPAAARILAKGMRTRSTAAGDGAADRARARGPGARRARPEQQGDRDRPRHHRADGADPCQQHPRQGWASRAGPRRRSTRSNESSSPATSEPAGRPGPDGSPDFAPAIGLRRRDAADRRAVGEPGRGAVPRLPVPRPRPARPRRRGRRPVHARRGRRGDRRADRARDARPPRDRRRTVAGRVRRDRGRGALARTGSPAPRASPCRDRGAARSSLAPVPGARRALRPHPGAVARPRRDVAVPAGLPGRGERPRSSATASTTARAPWRFARSSASPSGRAWPATRPDAPPERRTRPALPGRGAIVRAAACDASPGGS